MRKLISLKILLFIYVSCFSTVHGISQNPNTSNVSNNRSEMSIITSELDSSHMLIRICGVLTAKYNSYSVIEICGKDGSWTTSISGPLDAGSLNKDVINIHPLFGYDSLFNALLSCNFFNLEGDSNKYQSITLGTKNGFAIPFILPDDGMEYKVEIIRANQVLKKYSYYAPETIAATFKQYGLQDVDLCRFVAIPQVIRKHFSVTF